MKLTREGAARLGRYESRGFPVGDFEFLPEDFDGCFQNGKDHVALTLEEAKRLHDCAMFFWDDYEGTQYFTNDDKRFLTEMKKRIEQAEIKHLKKEIAQLKEDQARDNFYRQQFLKSMESEK